MAKTKITGVRIPDDVRQVVENMALSGHTTLSQQINKILREWIDSQAILAKPC